LSIGTLLDSHRNSIGEILEESLETEAEALKLYRDLLKRVQNRSVTLEEYARKMIAVEEVHAGEVRKMLRVSGDIKPARAKS
jgi:bacterioferritin